MVCSQAVHRNGDEVLVAHRYDGQVDPGEFGDVMGVRSSGVDDVTALDCAAIGLYAGDLAVLDQNPVDHGFQREPDAVAAGLMLVSFYDTGRGHVTIRRTPQHGLGQGEIHAGPAASG